MLKAGQNLEFLQAMLDAMADPIFVKDREHRWVAFNQAFCELIGKPREELEGKSDPDVFPPDQVEVFWRLDDELFASREANENEEFLTDEDGLVHTIWTRKYPIFDEEGEVLGLAAIISDITALRTRLDAAEQNAAEQEARIAAQQEMIDSMEVPVISVWDGVLLVPLIGEISPRRAALVLERLLEAIARESARVVFLDVSGVPSIDESSAATLVSAVRAAGLLGARAEVVGVSPAIARLFVERGIDLGGVTVHANLREGLRAVLERSAALA